MSESEWFTTTDPHKMLALLRERGSLSERKVRLFAVACCRRIWHLLNDQRSWDAVEVAEQYADERTTAREVVANTRAVAGIMERSGNAHDAVTILLDTTEEFDAAEVAMFAATAIECNSGYPSSMADYQVERTTQATILRDIFGDPFRGPTSIDRNWLAWNNGIIKQLAEAAYEARSLPSGHLDHERLAVLADALEEAGGDAFLLEHLRSPGPHVRGCFVIGLLLGKE